MKVTLKNSDLVFKVKGIVAGSYPTRDICLSQNAYYDTSSGSLVKQDISQNWGSSDFIPVDRLQSIVVSCTAQTGAVSVIPGIIYFSDKNVESYISVGYNSGSKIIDLLTSFTIPSGARFCILQSFLGSSQSASINPLPSDASIVFN